MVFVGFSCLYTFEESIELYEGLKESMIPWNLVEIAHKNSILTKNGTREKVYLDQGERKNIRIQRMVLNQTKYFDLFPACLIPNSLLKAEEILSFGEKGCFFEKNKRNNSFLKWLIEQNLDADIFSKLVRIGEKGNVFFYQTKEKYMPYTTKKGKKKEKEKNYIYLIFFA